MEISKAQMELATKHLERLAATIKNVPIFRGIPAAAFDKEHLVMLCIVYAEEWHKASERNESLLESKFVGEMNSAYYKAKANRIMQEALAVVEKQCPKPKNLSIWRKLWKRVKGWA